MPGGATMNFERVGQCRQQGAADVSSAELLPVASAGKMPAARCGSWRAPFRFSTCIGTTNLWIAWLRLGVRQSSSPLALLVGSPRSRQKSSPCEAEHTKHADMAVRAPLLNGP